MTQSTNKAQSTMPKEGTNKYRQIEERTYTFAKACQDYVKKLPKRVANYEYGRQLIRSSGFQAANYIEVNESLSKKDFVHRLRICRKETKESNLWLRLTEPTSTEHSQRDMLDQEAEELRKIFSAILDKSA